MSRMVFRPPNFPKTAFPEAFPPWAPQRPYPILRSLSKLHRAGRACTTQGRRIRRQVALRYSGGRAPEGPGSNAGILSAQQNAF